MSQRTVLSIGQCRPDQAAITHFLTSNFGTVVLTADLWQDAEDHLETNEVDLVLINRKLDADYSDGMEILRRLKAGSSTRDIPVMLVSNFEEWQQKAVAAGAIQGFGKSELNAPEAIRKLEGVLGEPA